MVAPYRNHSVRSKRATLQLRHYLSQHEVCLSDTSIIGPAQVEDILLWQHSARCSRCIQGLDVRVCSNLPIRRPSHWWHSFWRLLIRRQLDFRGRIKVIEKLLRCNEREMWLQRTTNTYAQARPDQLMNSPALMACVPYETRQRQTKAWLPLRAFLRGLSGFGQRDRRSGYLEVDTLLPKGQGPSTTPFHRCGCWQHLCRTKHLWSQ